MDNPDVSPRRWFRLVAALAALILAVALPLCVWAYLRHQTYLDQAHAVGELNHKVAVLNQPLTDAEFADLLALCDARDPETRFTALAVAAVDAVRRQPERRPLVLPYASRMLDDPEADVRRRAIDALRGLKARDHLPRIRERTASPDPREREAATRAVAALEAADQPN